MKNSVSKRVLQPGEPLPPGEPRRYRKREGYVELRWKVGVREYVWCYEHRLVHGLPVGKQVHHENRVRDDNDPSNLTPLTPAEHGIEHRRLDSVGESIRPRGTDGPRKKLDEAEVVRLHKAGVSRAEIGRLMGCSYGPVRRILMEAGYPNANR